jgi:DNA-binding NarL/FixJ family response regulator
MVFIRPLAVMISTLFSPLNLRERTLVAYIAPRGIVAAAVSALFALRLEEQGLDGAQNLVALTFIMIIGTVTLQSATARRVASSLGVQAPTPRSVLIVGAGRLARSLGLAFKKQQIPVLLADDDWNDIRQARMAGLDTYYGNPVSEHAAATLPLNSTRWLLAVSTRIETNSLACMRYLPELGKHFVFRIRLLASGEAPRIAHSGALQVPALFGEGCTHSSILERLDAGWSIRTTRLTEEFSWKQLVARFAEPPLLLFATDEREYLYFVTERDVPVPKTGWRVTVLAGAELPAPATEADAHPETGLITGG